MVKAYVTLLTSTHDEKNTVLVEVPDLEIITEGYGIEDAIYMARDAIGLSLITREDNNMEIPEPSDINDIDVLNSAFIESGNPIKTLVDIDVTEYRRKIDNKSVRRNVTIPNWLNQAAEAQHLNVSRVLQEALMEKLGV